MTRDFLWMAVGIWMMTVLSGCANDPNKPLIFVQSHILGISIGTSSAQAGGDFTLGYKDFDIAIIPVTVKQNNGDSTQVKATATAEFEDSLSVLGQFEVNTNSKQADVGLGKFFATGVAAKKLADGFAAKLGAQGANQSAPAEPDPKK